jgi:hypothetical protein
MAKRNKYRKYCDTKGWTPLSRKKDHVYPNCHGKESDCPKMEIILAVLKDLEEKKEKLTFQNAPYPCKICPKLFD